MATTEGGDKLSVAQLRAKFERGGGETPANFEARQAKLRAARHNLALRSQQLQDAKRNANPSSTRPSIVAGGGGSGTTSARPSMIWEKTGIKRPETSYPEVFDPTQTNERLKGMSAKELKQLITELGGEIYDCVEIGDLRQRALDLVHAPPKAFDVQTDDMEIDSMTVKQLKDYITKHNGDYRDCFEIGDLRLRAYDLKCAHHGGVTANGTMYTGDEEQDMGGGGDGMGAFFFPSLAFALASGDERAINRALLEFYFESNSPERMGEIDSLLEQYRGREEELFAQLASQQMEGSSTSRPPGGATAGGNDTTGPRVTFVFNPPPSQQQEGNVPVAPATVTPPPAQSSTTTTTTETPMDDTTTTTTRRRKSSFVVGGVKKGSQWEVNPQSAEFEDTMKAAGVPDAQVEAVLQAADNTVAPAQTTGGG